MISGIINVLKPAGITSNQALSKIKKLLHPNKIGHLGTLDPSASGVLPVCINKATKLFDFYLKKDKIYRTIFVFGKETDTLDSDGTITNQITKDVTIENVESILPKLIGKQNQVPPQYSSKKVNGKRAYELARNGIESKLNAKEIEVYDIKVISQIYTNIFLFEISCSSGTYVRSIARDMAKLLGTVAYVGAIIRTKSGSFTIENAIKLDDITEQSIVSLENILQDMPKFLVKDEFYDKIINGNSLKVEQEALKQCVVFCKKQLIGIGNIQNHTLSIQTNLWEKQ